MRNAKVCSFFCRRGLGLCLLAVGLLNTSGFSSTASAQPKTPGEDHVVTAPDGWPIHITYFAGKGSDSPAVILIPGADGNDSSRTRRVWDELATALNKRGAAVVTVDLRKHGDSVPPEVKDNPRLLTVQPGDYQAMALGDLEAVKDFLLKEHEAERLNIRKLGIAACGSSCLVAATFAANDWTKAPHADAPTLAARTPKGQDVRALFFLSPTASVPGLNLSTAMRIVGAPANGVAVNIYYNDGERTEKKAADSFFRFLKLRDPENKARLSAPGPPGASAEQLLVGAHGKAMQPRITDFFNAYLFDLNDPWQTRKSRLER